MNKWIILVKLKCYFDWNFFLFFHKKYSKYSLHVSFVVPKLLLVKFKVLKKFLSEIIKNFCINVFYCIDLILFKTMK